MALRLLTRARYSGLVTVAAVKAHLGITTSADDAILATLIEGVSDDLVADLGRPLARQQYLETFPLTTRLRLRLTALPLDRDSVTVTIDGTAATDFEIDDADTGQLYRSGGWSGSYPTAEAEERLVSVTYKAGYVCPDSIQTWATGLTLVAGNWVRPTSPWLSPLLFEVTVGGATGAGAEPTWPTTAGTTVAAGAATLTAREVAELPAGLRDLVLYVVRIRYEARKREAGLKSLSADGFSASWESSAASPAGIPEEVCRSLDRWRIA